jgi:hypothetical protein
MSRRYESCARDEIRRAKSRATDVGVAHQQSVKPRLRSSACARPEHRALKVHDIEAGERPVSRSALVCSCANTDFSMQLSIRCRLGDAYGNGNCD